MDETNRAKDEFFATDMYMFHITGFPPPAGVLIQEVRAPRGARLDVWPTSPADARHIPEGEGVMFSTPDFSLQNSGNRTLHAPKRSWKITLEHRAGRDGDDGGRQYFLADDDRTYRLKTNEDDHGTSSIPLVQNLLRNRDYRQYYLDYLEFLLDTRFHPEAFAALTAAGGLWDRVHQAAYLESATPHGQPFTGRQFTNDEVYLSGFKHNELWRGQEKAEGIVHYVRMRRDSARQQLGQLRKSTPRVHDGFPATLEPLPVRSGAHAAA
jgi:hypothetical protein